VDTGKKRKGRKEWRKQERKEERHERQEVKYGKDVRFLTGFMQ